MAGIVITGMLKNKTNGKIIAVGEWEALSYFLDEMKRLNPQTFSKRNFYIDVNGVSGLIAKSANVIMRLGFGNQLYIYSIGDAL